MDVGLRFLKPFKSSSALLNGGFPRLLVALPLIVHLHGQLEPEVAVGKLLVQLRVLNRDLQLGNGRRQRLRLGALGNQPAQHLIEIGSDLPARRAIGGDETVRVDRLRLGLRFGNARRRLLRRPGRSTLLLAFGQFRSEGIHAIGQCRELGEKLVSLLIQLVAPRIEVDLELPREFVRARIGGILGRVGRRYGGGVLASRIAQPLAGLSGGVGLCKRPGN